MGCSRNAVARPQGELEPVDETVIADAVDPLGRTASQGTGSLDNLVRLDLGQPVVWYCYVLAQIQDLVLNRIGRAVDTLLTRQRLEEGS
jgi:hypothetical protein